MRLSGKERAAYEKGFQDGRKRLLYDIMVAIRDNGRSSLDRLRECLAEIGEALQQEKDKVRSRRRGQSTEPSGEEAKRIARTNS